MSDTRGDWLKDSQQAELEAWPKRHRHKAVQWFEDHDSATNLQHGAFQKLQAAIFAGKVTTLVVWNYWLQVFRLIGLACKAPGLLILVLPPEPIYDPFFLEGQNDEK